jgi:hypothetical protein
MKYLCIVYNNEKVLQSMSAAEGQALVDEALDYNETLRRSGHFIAANALQPVHTATTVRVKNGKASVTDGPYAETHEQIGGNVLIEAKDLNEAIQLAAGIPPARMGAVEIRPIMELTRSSEKRPK